MQLLECKEKRQWGSPWLVEEFNDRVKMEELLDKEDEEEQELWIKQEAMSKPS